MKTKKRTSKSPTEITPLNKPRHTYINISLSRYKKILDDYWFEFDKTLEEYESNIMTGGDIDPRIIRLIRNLKKVDKWKSNLFILYLYFQKTRKLAEILKVNPSSLSVYISNIKKEIKC